MAQSGSSRSILPKPAHSKYYEQQVSPNMLQADIPALRAPNCESCPRGNGETWCNGDCYWSSGSCQQLLQPLLTTTVLLEDDLSITPKKVPKASTVVGPARKACPTCRPEVEDEWK